jgi:hypothetical protein
MKTLLPTKQQIEENFGYSIHEACTRLGIGINKLKELCRSYSIARWPKYRKTRTNADMFQTFSIKGNLSTEKKPKSISKQTKILTSNLGQHYFPPQTLQKNEAKTFPMEKPRERNSIVNSKMSIVNLCN